MKGYTDRLEIIVVAPKWGEENTFKKREMSNGRAMILLRGENFN